MKVVANNGLTALILINHGKEAGGGVSGQPENPPGYATDVHTKPGTHRGLHTLYVYLLPSSTLNLSYIRLAIGSFFNLPCLVLLELEGARASTGLCVDEGSRENNTIQTDLPDGGTNLRPAPGVFMRSMFGVPGVLNRRIVFNTID